MIQQAYITGWRSIAPWSDDAQVEQDLVLSRAVVGRVQTPLPRSGLRSNHQCRDI